MYEIVPKVPFSLSTSESVERMSATDPAESDRNGKYSKYSFFWTLGEKS